MGAPWNATPMTLRSSSWVCADALMISAGTSCAGTVAQADNNKVSDSATRMESDYRTVRIIRFLRHSGRSNLPCEVVSVEPAFDNPEPSNWAGDAGHVEDSR